MKQAKIKCPHCKCEITVRQIEGGIDLRRASKIFEAADEMFAAMDKAFAKLFHPSLWK